MTRPAASTNPPRGGPRTERGGDTGGWKEEVFAGLFGALLGLSLLKFGNPVIMEKYVEKPADIYEWIFNPWPIEIAYRLLEVACGLLGILVVTRRMAVRWKTSVPGRILILPGVWLAWEFVAGTQTVSAVLTQATLAHFTACVAWFYLGLFWLAGMQRLRFFWAGVAVGFLLVLAVGFQQHFGGLEETRRYYNLYVLPTLKEPPPPEFLKKMATNRIFSTLFYPNTLAGVILMLLPVISAVFWSLKERLTIGARRFVLGVIAAAALACLYWSGSKGGWLLLLVVGFVFVLFLPLGRRVKLILICAVLVFGLAGFAAKYAGFFRRGATSVVARFDYWRAALQTVEERPLFGTGPGTFAIPYARLKSPESEMARLVHNDYLEQAADSGVPGFLIYAALVINGLVFAYRNSGLRLNWVKLAVWLGLLGWALQSMVEFGLYIPATSWTAFCLLGWLMGSASNQIDTTPGNR